MDNDKQSIAELLDLVFADEAPDSDLAPEVAKRIARIRTAMEFGRLLFKSPMGTQEDEDV